MTKLTELFIMTNKSYPNWKFSDIEIEVEEYDNPYAMEKEIAKKLNFEKDEYISTCEYVVLED